MAILAVFRVFLPFYGAVARLALRAVHFLGLDSTQRHSPGARTSSFGILLGLRPGLTGVSGPPPGGVFTLSGVFGPSRRGVNWHPFVPFYTVPDHLEDQVMTPRCQNTRILVIFWQKCPKTPLFCLDLARSSKKLTKTTVF